MSVQSSSPIPFRPGALAAALRLGVAAAMAGGVLSVLPVPSVAAAAEARSYRIPAGPLGPALARYAVEAGVALSFDPGTVEGRTTAGIDGEYTVEGGFAVLLQGSGYELVRAGDGQYALRPMAGGSGVTTLSPVQVVGATVQAATTEGTGSYTTGSMNTATKLPLSIRETPQSVTVITRDRIEDQALNTASDLLRNTPGITITATAPYRETFFSRGYAVETYLFDGLPITSNSSRRGTFLNDLAMYDRVEVVRGAAGLTQGSGTPSAAINFVRKRPTRDFQASLQGEAGRWNHLAATGDVSGPLNASGSLRGRAVVRWQDADSFQDVVTEDRKLAYFIAEADLTRSTLLTLSFSHQENENNTTYGGLPTALDGGDLKLPRSTYLGNTWNFWNDDTSAVFASVEHRFDSGWKLSLSANQIWGDQEQLRAGVGWNATDEQWDQSGGWAELYNDRSSYDLHAQGPFGLFGRDHELVVGAAQRIAKEGNDTAGYYSIPSNVFARDIDIYNWTHDALMPEFEVDYRFRSREEQYGFYSTARLNLADPLKLIVGLRVDWFDFENTQDIWGWDSANQVRTEWTYRASGYDYDRHHTKYAGLIYDIGKHYSAYASYTDIFKAQSQRTPADEFIKPIVGENYEAGLKAEYFDGALNINAAVFQIDEGNRAMPVGPCPFNENMTCHEPTGMVRSEGYDLEIQGALTANWQIGAGYTYVETEVEKDANPARVGLRLNTQMPKDQFKLSMSYRLPGGKWRVGGNLRWQDDVFFQWTGGDYRSEQDAYTVVDAMLGYRHDKHLDLQLNVTNLFDEVYYSSINAQPVIWGGNTVYGEPRNVLLTARYRF